LPAAAAQALGTVDEHTRIVEAIGHRGRARAVKLSMDHLEHIGTV
jgi:DNA-binding GntR family transcriptional regulator